MALDRIIVTMTLDAIVAFYTTVAFVIPLVALLTSSTVMWRKEHLWNFSVPTPKSSLHLSSLIHPYTSGYCQCTAQANKFWADSVFSTVCAEYVS
jgi:hypothetical protein